MLICLFHYYCIEWDGVCEGPAAVLGTQWVSLLYSSPLPCGLQALGHTEYLEEVKRCPMKKELLTLLPVCESLVSPIYFSVKSYVPACPYTLPQCLLKGWPRPILNVNISRHEVDETSSSSGTVHLQPPSPTSPCASLLLTPLLYCASPTLSWGPVSAYRPPPPHPSATYWLSVLCSPPWIPQYITAIVWNLLQHIPDSHQKSHIEISTANTFPFHLSKVVSNWPPFSFLPVTIQTLTMPSHYLPHHQTLSLSNRQLMWYEHLQLLAS